MICWSCERAGSEDALCGNCGAILPPSASKDYFGVLGLPRRYEVDLRAAEERFRGAARQFHPDRFSRADPRARRASLQRTVQLNEAWRTIGDPVRRAEYLLGLYGYVIGAEEGAPRPIAPIGNGSGPGSGSERVAVSAALLGEILELREALGEARAADDEGAIVRMADDMRVRIDGGLTRVAEAFAALEGGLDEKTSPRLEAGGHLQRAAAELIAIRYFRRFLDEVAVHEEERAAQGRGAARG